MAYLEVVLEPKEVIQFLLQLLQREVDYLLVAIQALVKPVDLVVVVVVLVAAALLLEELETKVDFYQQKVFQVVLVIITLLDLAVAAGQAVLV
jgi:hypothetical protein